jgi:hypothetical protein
VRFFCATFLVVFPVGGSRCQCWAVAFGISFLFADWAFSVRTLSAKEMGIFIGIWMGITITLQLLYAQFLIGDVRYALNSIELYVQYLLELLAIFFGVFARAEEKNAISFG